MPRSWYKNCHHTKWITLSQSVQVIWTRLTFYCAHLRLNNKKNENKLGEGGNEGDGGDGGDGGDRGGEVDQQEVSTIRLGMLESSGFRKYSTLLVIQLFSRRLCHCLCIRFCLCICVPNSFLNSYYHKLSENVWVWGCGATRSEFWTGVTIAGQTTEQPNKER